MDKGCLIGPMCCILDSRREQTKLKNRAHRSNGLGSVDFTTYVVSSWLVGVSKKGSNRLTY